MLNNLNIKNFTVFPSANLQFSKYLNVIVGENGSGKTHLLKVAYSALATSWEESRKPTSSTPTKALMQTRLADKLINVFRPESLGRLARRKQGRERCDIKLLFEDKKFNFEFSFSTNSKTEVLIEQVPKGWLDTSPAYIPTRELLSIFPNFVSVYEGHYLEFEETWRDTCILLGAPLQRGTKEKRIQELLAPLETSMGGSIELDKNGRFYLKNERGRFEMPLIAEGQRKLAMLARLIATGVLMDKGFLFWDEPEANLNPLLIKQVAQSIVSLSKIGIQVFIATHSLFLLRELEILMTDEQNTELNSRFFGLHFSDDGVVVKQGDTIDEIGDITTLDEELAQSDRFISSGV
ncbi:DNA replication and repair protein RecF [Dolichospermum sp. UHCC 0315A]|jgi:predicted ATP-dependent endonuclease of OLD family|uniref:AAA family ATPase n=1 Tax=Dolichospermum sp. UHCC 0315A TaxID=1914871 RepID=UPI0011E85FEA|nr:ATP-binding protein [Dolichospermum sp. UHCC 0315A]QEI42428.1 DNA replication and repair protein RecF [Dolichospermum sp. UHCC 0315A]